MILKINGVPASELVKEGVEIGMNIKDAYHLIHTPINLDVGLNTHHLFTADVNLFNLPLHAFNIVKPHVSMIFDSLF